MSLSENGKGFWKKGLLIFCIFIGFIMLTAQVDYVAEHPSVGFGVRLTWLMVLVSMGIVLPIVFLYLAGNKTRERIESDKKGFIVAIILFAVANAIPIIFYVVMGIPPGFFIFLQLGLMGLLPAYVYQPKKSVVRVIILVLLFAAVIMPLALLVNFEIDKIWVLIPSTPTVQEATIQTMYYMFYWGLLMPFVYLAMAIGWKFGGGTNRQGWNIFMAGMVLQYSTLEDFLYFALNGQPLPGVWPWMSEFVINLEALFGNVPTDVDIFIFCVIMVFIAIFILFDGHGKIWAKLSVKKTK
jgi:hypothetical protein